MMDGIEVHSEEDGLYGWGGGQRSQSGLQGNYQTLCVNKYLGQVLAECVSVCMCVCRIPISSSSHQCSLMMTVCPVTTDE